MKVIGITVLAVIMLAGTAIAQGPGGPGQNSGFGMENLERFRMMFRHMDLTEEQADEIESITEAAREEVMAIMEEAGRPEDHTSFMDVFTSPTLTVSDLEETMGQMDEVREAMRDVIFEAMVDIHDVLTAEQLEKLAEMVEEHTDSMGHGSGMGHSMR